MSSDPKKVKMSSKDSVESGIMPGLTERESDEMRARPPRCGECEECVLVEESKALFMPNPPFSHATDAGVEGWNRFLLKTPCRNSYRCGLMTYAEDLAGMWGGGGEPDVAKMKEDLKREREALCDEARARRSGEVAGSADTP